jgi:hypothetical protein
MPKTSPGDVATPGLATDQKPQPPTYGSPRR